jgi:hypothetical protein
MREVGAGPSGAIAATSLKNFRWRIDMDWNEFGSKVKKFAYAHPTTTLGIVLGTVAVLYYSAGYDRGFQAARNLMPHKINVKTITDPDGVVRHLIINNVLFNKI